MARKKSGYKHDDDNIPYMTDPMKRALDTGKDLPIEQMVSDKGLDQINKAKLERAAPVHAETLRPMTQAAAAQRTMFRGDGVLPQAPSTRRIIPKPFQRERIVLSGAHGHGKVWSNVRAEQIREGDIIPDIGMVDFTLETTRREDIAHEGDYELNDGVATGTLIYVEGAGGNNAVFAPHQQVRVFREAEDG
jgi:hypothetical protein